MVVVVVVVGEEAAFTARWRTFLACASGFNNTPNTVGAFRMASQVVAAQDYCRNRAASYKSQLSAGHLAISISPKGVECSPPTC
jgi:hypothetical protein